MNKDIMHKLIQFIVSGNTQKAIDETTFLLNSGIDKKIIVTKCLEIARIQLNDKCTAENFNLLEIMLAGLVVRAVMKLLYPGESAIDASKGTIVLATLEGDVHDLVKIL